MKTFSLTVLVMLTIEFILAGANRYSLVQVFFRDMAGHVCHGTDRPQYPTRHQVADDEQCRTGQEQPGHQAENKFPNFFIQFFHGAGDLNENPFPVKRQIEASDTESHFPLFGQV